MNNVIAWRLLILWIIATAILFGVQLIFDHRLVPEVLVYLLPGCTASYLMGRSDVIRERKSHEETNG
jgi:hypothetical protein